MSNVDPVRTAVNRAVAAVIGDKLDADGTGNYFETDDDNPTTSTPTLTIDVTSNVLGAAVNRFELTSLRYYLNPTNAVTYTLYLFEKNSADDTTHLSELVFQSPAAQADSTLYWYRIGASGTPDTIATADNTLPVIVNLGTTGKLYYTINWSGAPANTPGFIKLRGNLLK